MFYYIFNITKYYLIKVDNWKPFNNLCYRRVHYYKSSYKLTIMKYN